MPAKYVMKQSPKKGFRWSLVATNGRVIATSQFYETRRAAMAGIESARKNAPAAVVVDAEAKAAPKAEAKPKAPGKGTGSGQGVIPEVDEPLKTRH